MPYIFNLRPTVSIKRLSLLIVRVNIPKEHQLLCHKSMPPSSSVWKCCEVAFGDGAGCSGSNARCGSLVAAAVLSTLLVLHVVGGSSE